MSNQSAEAASFRPVPSRIVGPVPLAAVAAIIGLTCIAAFCHPRHPEVMPASPVVRERLLRFADREDGAVIVTNESTGRLVQIITGQSGFLRGTMSGLARIRRIEGIGKDVPFRVALYADGQFVLSDPATHKTIELEAFGPSNAAVFAALLGSD